MSNLHIQNLRKSNTSDLLTAEETSLIVGGRRSRSITTQRSSRNESINLIDNSFNDVIYGGPSDSVIYADPLSIIFK